MILMGVVLTGCGSTFSPTARQSGGLQAPSFPSTPATVQQGPVAATAARTNSHCSVSGTGPNLARQISPSRNLAVVSLRGSQTYVVRDITDITHATTVSTFDQLDGPQFISSTQLSARSFPSENDLVSFPLSGSPPSVVALGCNGMIDFAWSPDGTAAAYVTDLDNQPGSQFHIVSGGQNKVITAMPSVPWGVDCGGGCADNVDSRLLYSPDGKYISFVQSWGGPALRLWTSDGHLLLSADAGKNPVPTMSVWSGDHFYFRDTQGVHMWRAGTQSLVLQGVSWIRPKASPSGGAIVYEAKDSSGTPNIYLLDTASGGVREIARSRSEPAFLTGRYIWWREERPCTSKDPYPCGAFWQTIPTGRDFVYDLNDRTETQSVVTAVFDVWPHAA